MTDPDLLQHAAKTLALLGVSPADLLRDAVPVQPHGQDRRAVAAALPALVRDDAHDCAPVRMTVAEYLPIVIAATGPACRTYLPYWQRLVREFGDRLLDAVIQTDVERLSRTVRSEALTRRNSNGGVGAQENFLRAARRFFGLAVGDKLIDTSPAAGIPMPKRPPNLRRGLTPSEVDQLWQVTVNGGNDPALDTLILRLHLETAARRDGALALRLMDLDLHQQGVHLLEKGGKSRFQPTTRVLLDELMAHAHRRGARDPEDQVLRYAPRAGSLLPGAPLTRRRYNTLVERWQSELPWAARYGVSIHWARHTTLTAIERIAGHAVARAYAGHGCSDTTSTYVKASLREIAAAHSVLTGELHPLAAEDDDA